MDSRVGWLLLSCFETPQKHNKKLSAMRKQLKIRVRSRGPFQLLSKKPLPSDSDEEQTQLIETQLQRSLSAQSRQFVLLSLEPWLRKPGTLKHRIGHLYECSSGVWLCGPNTQMWPIPAYQDTVLPPCWKMLQSHPPAPQGTQDLPQELLPPTFLGAGLITRVITQLGIYWTR